MEKELWQNPNAGRVQVAVTDDRGNRVFELIGPNRKLHITPADRRYNSEMAADPKLDVFSNGALTPLRLLEGDEDEDNIKANPNHISEDEMRALLKEHHTKFDKRLGEITNTGAVQRMLQIATSEDMDVTVRVVTKLRERLEELAPNNVTETEQIGSVAGNGDGMTGISKPVTPR